jgi:cytochrome b involved in lipid metabolism
MNKTIIIIIILIIIIGGGVFLYFNRGGEPEAEEMAELNGEETKQEEEKDITVLEMLRVSSATQITELVAVDGSNSSGTAYILRKDGKVYHAVVASMPDPGEGNSYEGWLVQPSPLRFFSTGVMEKNEEDLWILEYTGDKEYSTYIRAVITEETSVDLIPEKHIIEGDFPVVETEPGFTLGQVAQHNSDDDCWLVIDNKVYDVTEFISGHPGGQSIVEGCGKDATTLFETRPMGSGTPHSDRARTIREDYYIGDLK